MILQINRVYMIVIFSFVSILFFFNFPFGEKEIDKGRFVKSFHSRLTQDIEDVTCIIDDVRHFQCLLKGDKVFLPFNNFIKKQFGVDEKLIENTFKYSTSRAKIKVPELSSYNPTGEFGVFGTYKVELRNRVRCINAEYGVPMSVQWNSIPYFYPIQIAQYALQHYSKLKNEVKSKLVTFKLSHFKSSQNVVIEQIKIDGNLGIRLKNDDASESASVSLDSDTELPVLNFLWLPASEMSWFLVEVEDLTTNRLINLKYVFKKDNRCVWTESNNNDYIDKNNKTLNFVYSLGKRRNLTKYLNIVIDVMVDSLKAVQKKQKRKISLKRLLFYGSANIKLPVRQQNNAHFEIFFKAVDWFLFHQNSAGGWSVSVPRSIFENRLILQAGWHSAMAQGHVISVFVRAYHLNKKKKYIESIQRALHLFALNASEGGVVNRLYGYDWYEEYPTTPGTFVLNGFMYSLIGLYDASSIPTLKNETLKLFETGIASLKHFLPLYDSGSGSIYDLRHLELKTAPNLARWDYHAVHIYLLKWLFKITGEKQFNNVADRWIRYTQGKFAKHN